MSAKVRTCLWFDDDAEDAARFYVSLLPDSRIEDVGYYNEAGPGKPGSVVMVEFTLCGTPYQALNGGPHFTLDEAVSISVKTRDQRETDELWEKLLAGGGSESQCGWLKDRFGLSWQVVPEPALALLKGPHGASVMQALMGMRKIDIAALRTAAA